MIYSWKQTAKDNPDSWVRRTKCFHLSKLAAAHLLGW